MTSKDISPTAIEPKSAFLRERELAERWQTSQRTLQRWRASGEGPEHIRIGNAIRYRVEDVIAYEARMRRGGLLDDGPADT